MIGILLHPNKELNICNKQLTDTDMITQHEVAVDMIHDSFNIGVLPCYTDKCLTV
jgi:hypothetical protein